MRGKYRKRGKEESEDHERKRHNLVQVVNRMKREKMERVSSDLILFKLLELGGE